LTYAPKTLDTKNSDVLWVCLLRCHPETGLVLLRSPAVLPYRPPAYTLVRWVDESAFISRVQTRPLRTLGRPVHRGVAPIDYRPASQVLG